MSEQNRTAWTPEQLEYIDWLALPKSERKPKTLTAFAKKIDYSRTTLWEWKQLPGFMDEVARRVRLHVTDDLSEIFDAMTDKAKNGDVKAARLVFEAIGQLKYEHAHQHTVSWEELMRSD